MKKLLALLLSVLLLSLAFTGCDMLDSFFNDESENNSDDNQTSSTYSEGLEFELNENKTAYILTGSGTCEDTEIIIPPSHNDLPVVAIGENAFNYRSGITSVIIPDGVTSIKDNAFYFCYNLERISIPDSVTVIGDNTFSGCTGLLIVTVGNGVTKIGEYAFSDCFNLMSLTIGSNVESIGKGAFSGCISLFRITYNASEKEWNEIYKGENWDSSTGDYTIVYNHAHNYSSVVTAPTFTEQGYTTYTCVCGDVYVSDYTPIVPYYSVGLEYELNEDGTGYILTGIGTATDTDIVIPSTYERLPVVAIGANAFTCCESLSSITIPSSVTSIGNEAFSDSGLTSITIPDSVTSIGNLSLFGCRDLINVSVDANNQYYQSINDTLYSKDGKTLVQYAAGKSDISFDIPEGVTSIGDGAFRMSDLETVTIPDSVTHIGKYAFLNCIYLTSITIPDSATYIGEEAFCYCSKLTTVTIGNGVTFIDKDAFYRSGRLTTINFTGTESEWHAIEKDENWDRGTNNYTIVFNYTDN